MRVALAPPPGIVSDETTFARPGTWADGSNVRFWRGKPETIGGWTDALSGTTLTGVCRNAYPWVNASGSTNIAFGTHSKLQVYYGGGLYDITPAGLVTGSIDSSAGGSGWGSGTWGSGTWGNPALVYYARTWALATYGSYLMAVPRGGTLYEWQGNIAALATEVTQAPDTITYMLVTPERQVLAFGCNEETSGNFNPLCIRGSDIENYTSWTTTAANNAFEHILEGGGRIVAARIIGSYVAVWTDRGLHLGQFLGNPGQTYRFDLVADHCGLLGPNAVEVIDQTAYWVGSDLQFHAWSPGGVPQIIPCGISRDFRDNVVAGQKEKIAATTVSQYGEVWWHYPDEREGTENSRYVAVGTLPDSGWFRGVMARTAAVDAGALSYPLMVTYGGVAYYHEYSNTAAGAALTWHLQSSDQYFEEGNRRVMVRGVTPDTEDQVGDVSLTITARDYPKSSATTFGPYTLTTTTTKKDLRVSGRLVTTKFSGGDAAGSFMRLGKPVFDVAALGER